MSDQFGTFDNDDDVDINLRPPDLVAARVLVVASVCRFAALLAPSGLRQSDDAAAERFDIRAWFELESLTDEIAPSERRFLDREPTSIATDVSAMSWQAEALVALGWALALLPELAPPTAATDPSPLLDVIPRPYDATDSFREIAALRDEAEIARERERAELWHWRSDLADLQAAAPASERRALAALVRDVTREATVSGFLTGTGDDDFQVAGRPFLTLSVENRDTIALIAAQRHHALNWLCGFGPSWDDVPLDL